MTYDRPYHLAISMDAAVPRSEGSRGTRFDPAPVDAFQALDHRTLL
jgi:HD-GYP domain-containing protein (c-di-GMP phosphodiesterase class II)